MNVIRYTHDIRYTHVIRYIHSKGDIHDIIDTNVITTFGCSADVLHSEEG